MSQPRTTSLLHDMSSPKTSKAITFNGMEHNVAGSESTNITYEKCCMFLKCAQYTNYANCDLSQLYKGSIRTVQTFHNCTITQTINNCTITQTIHRAIQLHKLFTTVSTHYTNYSQWTPNSKNNRHKYTQYILENIWSCLKCSITFYVDKIDTTLFCYLVFSIFYIVGFYPVGFCVVEF